MPASSWQLDGIVPHRGQMLLLDRVVSCDVGTKTLVAEAVARPEWSENWVAIELMAQTAAALAGVCDREAGYTGEPRPGFLLGARKLELAAPRFETGRSYMVKSVNTYSDDESASFDCEIALDGAVVAKATLNAYRPADMGKFMEEQK